ncbi:DUF2142 domain-containing protein [Georgenia sp. H159]|uniref:DUF2142 domain-containing protein n=1 Tax=Georgenia sp. H159 TaxID=3076115 RepID=UPI002D767357|nr:phospholipid carrier-dependent glycosyltransferase [Georgenia sp. H159]
MSPVTYRRSVVAITALFGSLLVLWAVLTPAFRAPDEPQHFNSVIRLLEGGGWPEPQAAVISDGVRVAVDEAGWAPVDEPFIRQSAAILPGEKTRTGQPLFVELDPGDPADRAVIGEVELPVGSSSPAVDQMTQHPPAYYALGAGVLKLLGGEGWRWDQQLLAVRLLSALLVVWLVPLAAATTRNLGGSSRAALVAAVSLTGVSQLAHINSAVTNDALTNLSAGAVLWLASLALTRRHTWPLVIGTGLVLGVGLLTKGFLLAAIPVVAVSFVLGHRENPRPPRRWGAAFVALAVAFAVGGWWWLRNLIRYGVVQPAGMPPRPYLDTGVEPNVTALLVGARRGIVSSAWGNYGWMELSIPLWLSYVASVMLLLAVVVTLVMHRAGRLPLAILLLLPFFTLLILLYGAWQAFVNGGYLAGLQGRYLFIGATAFAACVGIATDAVSSRLPAGLRSALLLAVPVGSVALGAYGLAVAFQGFYHQAGEPVRDALGRWEVWSALGTSGIALILLLPCATGLLALALVGRAVTTPEPAQPAGPRHSRR